jgi:hypothetical protein
MLHIAYNYVNSMWKLYAQGSKCASMLWA